MRFPENVAETKWAVALSGGADSTALLCRCLEAGIPVTALHYNHGFADENGDEAETFCRELCESLGVPLIVGRCEDAWFGRPTKEVFARNHRLAFFAEVMSAQGLTGLMLGHQADDRAENLILRLARGCGLSGLTSFSWKGALPGAPQIRLWRPLLDEHHADQIAWLKAHSRHWVEDISNADTSIPRNAIRRELIPHLPHFVDGANASADILAEEDAYLQALAEAATEVATSETLTLRAGIHPVLARRALHTWCPTLNRAWLDGLLALPVGAIVQVPSGLRLKKIAAFSWQNLGLCKGRD